MAINEAKLYVRVTPDFERKFTEWAKRLGLTKSQLGNICVQSGLNAVIRAVSPEESMTPEQIVSILKAAESGGLSVDLSEFQKRGGRK